MAKSAVDKYDKDVATFMIGVQESYEWMLKDILFRKFNEKGIPPMSERFNFLQNVEHSEEMRAALENYGILCEIVKEIGENAC